MDAHTYDLYFERRQEELEREVALRRLAHDVARARRALRVDAPVVSDPPVPRRHRSPRWSDGGLRILHVRPV